MQRVLKYCVCLCLLSLQYIHAQYSVKNVKINSAPITFMNLNFPNNGIGEPVLANNPQGGTALGTRQPFNSAVSDYLLAAPASEWAKGFYFFAYVVQDSRYITDLSGVSSAHNATLILQVYNSDLNPIAGGPVKEGFNQPFTSYQLGMSGLPTAATIDYPSLFFVSTQSHNKPAAPAALLWSDAYPVTTIKKASGPLQYFNFNAGGWSNHVLADSIGEFQTAPFSSTLNTYLTGLTTEDWNNGIYVFTYCVDSTGKYLGSLQSVSANSPAKMYVAVYDHTLSLKQHVVMDSSITKPMYAWACGFNGLTSTPPVYYPHSLLFISNTTQTKSAVSKSTLFGPLQHVKVPDKAGSSGSASESDVIAAGEDLASLALNFTFSNGNVVPLTFVASQINNIKQEISGGKSVSVSCDLDGTGTHYGATIHAKTSSGNVSGFPLTISSANFKPSGGSPVPTSNNHNTQKKITYKTSNMKKEMSLQTGAFTFAVKPGSTVVTGDGDNQVKRHHHISTAKSTSAGGRF